MASQRRFRVSDGTSHSGTAATSPRLLEPTPPLPPPAFSLLGWTVLGADGRVVGTVDELVIGPAAGRARYLAISLDPDWETRSAAVGRIIAPLACARLRPGRSEITLRALPAADCVRLPSYEGGAISADDEAAIWMTCATVAIPQESESAIDDAAPRPRLLVDNEREMRTSGG